MANSLCFYKIRLIYKHIHIHIYICICEYIYNYIYNLYIYIMQISMVSFLTLLIHVFQ